MIAKVVCYMLPLVSLLVPSDLWAGNLGLSIDGIYLKAGDIEQKSISAACVIERRAVRGRSFAEYIASHGSRRWQISASGNISGISIGYKRLPKQLQIEIGLDKQVGWGFSLGFLWRSEWIERWLPGEEGRNFAVMKVTFGKSFVVEGLPISVLAENKQVAGYSESRAEWRVLVSTQVKRLYLKLERRWDLAKLSLGIKL